MLWPQHPNCTDESLHLRGREEKRRPSSRAVTMKGLGGNFMASVFCVQVASEAGNRLQANIVCQRAAVSTPDPLQYRAATDVCFRSCGCKCNKIEKDVFSVPEFVPEGSASGKIPIDVGAQHDASFGHG